MGQLEKNTVKAENQLKENEYIKFYPGGGEIKVLIVGNSITRHGVNEEIGWLGDYGMAASSEEKDYVHIIMREINSNHGASYCICQASAWESNYKNPKDIYGLFEEARDFAADLIIIRLIENVPTSAFDKELFKEEYVKFISYLNKTGMAKIVITDGFWKHPGDEQIAQVAKEQGYAFVTLGDLGELDEMKAIKLFKHDGVAQHPGDKGMQNIAERILEKLCKGAKNHDKFTKMG